MNPGQRDYFRGKQPEDEVMNSTETNEDFPKGYSRTSIPMYNNFVKKLIIFTYLYDFL